MSVERALNTSRQRIAQRHHFVRPCTGQHLAVGTVRHARHPLRRTPDDRTLRARREVPEPDRRISTCTCQRRPIRAEGDVGDLCFVSAQRGPRLASCDIPYGDAPIMAGAGQPLAIWAEGEFAQEIRILREDGLQATCCDIPEQHA